MADNQPFLQKVINQSNLETENEAQVATNALFRIMRDLVTRDTSDRVAEELREEEPSAEMELKDLWKDTNPMVSFFSRLSPLRPLNIKPGTFMLRFKQEGALPESANREQVVKAVFSATKEELSQERIDEISGSLPDEIRQMWVQA